MTRDTAVVQIDELFRIVDEIQALGETSQEMIAGLERRHAADLQDAEAGMKDDHESARRSATWDRGAAEADWTRNERWAGAVEAKIGVAKGQVASQVRRSIAGVHEIKEAIQKLLP